MYSEFLLISFIFEKVAFKIKLRLVSRFQLSLIVKMDIEYVFYFLFLMQSVINVIFYFLHLALTREVLVMQEQRDGIYKKKVGY